VNAFSPDGSSWWEGARWVPTAEIQLTLPETSFERSGGLTAARRLLAIQEWMFLAMYLIGATIIGLPVVLVLAVVRVIVKYRAFKGYRVWSIELLDLATAKLLGPDEPMLAGETTLWPPVGLWPSMRRDYAIAVTRSHVLMFRFAHSNSPLMGVVFAARTSEVDLLVIRGLIRQSLGVTYAGRRWFLPGMRGIFKGEDVLESWRKVRNEEALNTRR
jgi:hypothetical protein